MSFPITHEQADEPGASRAVRKKFCSHSKLILHHSYLVGPRGRPRVGPGTALSQYPGCLEDSESGMVYRPEFSQGQQ